MPSKLPIALVVFVALVGFRSTPAAAGPQDLALADDPAPLASYKYLKFDEVQVSDSASRTVAVIATLSSSTARPRRALCVLTLSPAAASTVLACTGMTVPGIGTFVSLNHLSMSPTGKVVWQARVKGGRSGIFADDFTPVSRAGDAVPGGGVLSGPSDPVVTTTEGTVFRASINQVSEALDEALLRCDGNCSGGSGTLEVLVRKSDPVPDRVPRVLCDFMQFNASNFGIVFLAETKSTDCAGAEAPKVGVFRKAHTGAVETLALEGEASDPPGTTYGTLGGRPSIGDDGFAVFRAEPVGARRVLQIFLCGPDPIVCPAARPLAVVVTGATDGSGRTLGGFSEPVLGDLGEFAFTAKFKGGCGVFVRDPSGTIEPVGLKGDAVDGGNAALECSREARVSPGGNVALIGDARVPPKGKRRQGVFLAP